MLIVGLGNPGVDYDKTHHNIGFMAVDKIAVEYRVSFKKSIRFNALIAEVKENGQKHYLLKPLTYMNNSGLAVRKVANYYKINPTDILVIHDDMDLPLAKIRIRKSGSSGGHNGIKSIIQELGTEAFGRVRIGTDRDKSRSNDKVIDFVLSKFTKEELEVMNPILDMMPNIGSDYLKYQIDYIMNHYN